jgi:hypothetical protein
MVFEVLVKRVCSTIRTRRQRCIRWLLSCVYDWYTSDQPQTVDKVIELTAEDRTTFLTLSLCCSLS